MGRSKFPGKPSKSVMKERIRVLYKNENGKSEKGASNQKNEISAHSNCDDCSSQNKSAKCKEPSSISGKINNYPSVDIKNKSPISFTEDLGGKNDKKQNQKNCSGDILEDDENKESSTGSCASNDSGTITSSGYITLHPKCSLMELDKLIKKKTVTFKNVLEISDDTLVKKKTHNVLHKGPLVSIMKKECHSLQSFTSRGDGIVRPSRLTEILKNNENIDKTKSLSFRSIQMSNKPSDSSGNKKNDSEDCSTTREGTKKLLFLNKEREKCDFNLKNQNENVEKTEQQPNETIYSQSLDKWKLHKFSPNNDTYEYWENESYKRSPKRKDSTLSNKIILRQPRLHFEPRSEIQPRGKQNTQNSCNIANLLATNICTYSVCGVCNTTVNSKNLQNRKYGIIACDACRKFISKITKKTVSSSTNPLTTFRIHCSKIDGECAISSLPKNNVKSFKKIYDERCTACWLKKCIKAFHFPSGHKLRLNAILSETHKSKIDAKPVNKSFISLHSSVNTFTHTNALTDGNDNINSEVNHKIMSLTGTGASKTDDLNSRDVGVDSNTNGQLPESSITLEILSKTKESQCGKPFDEGITSSLKHVKPYSNVILSKTSQSLHCKSAEQQLPSAVMTSEYPKRQKIDFKGPRVKHVCRSASIALGQQIATFSNDDEEKVSQTKLDIENSRFTNSLFGNMYFSSNDQENVSQKPMEDVNEFRKQLEEGGNLLKQGFALNIGGPKTLPSQNPFTSAEIAQVASIKVKKPTIFDRTFGHENNNFQFPKSTQKYSGKKKILMLAQRNISSLSKRNLMRITKARNFEKKSKLISIDFLDGYVPAEVNQTGFGLILTESVPVCALCFLCGSMDLNYLLFCASCCEPYHSYCIQEDNNAFHTIHEEKNVNNNEENNLINQLNWVCPRCTVCYTCNMSSGAKVKCQKCKKNYHSTCMGTSKGLLGADRPLICRSCLKCQTCSTTKVSKYVGNQPICTQCFELRMSGSRCPLCSNLFDNILDLIILECGICKRLIHAKCEGLTEEQSNLLSNLPGNIEFVCKKCSLANDEAKILAKEWRDAVYDELRSGLLDILKLLSGSRQSDVLKKNKKNRCLCDFDNINKKYHALSYVNYKSENSSMQEEKSEENDCLLNNLLESAFHSKCLCSKNSIQQSELNNSLSLFDIKKKINNREYVSLFDFNADMNDVIMPLKNDELILAYKEILSEKFSWFQNETKTCTDALEEDMFESNYSFPLEEIITEDHNVTAKLLDSEGKVLNSLKQEVDNRVCALCQKAGDGGILQESRLLYNGYNTWIHANCAIWSNDVYEEFDGTLQNVHIALNCGRLMKCVFCKVLGATLKCFFKTCCSYYHFQCARKSQCIFTADKSVYCSDHCNQAANSTSNETFTVFRPLYIDFDKTYKKYVDPCKVQFMLGSLSVIQLGTVCAKFSDTPEAIVPINFMCTRLYWSCREPWKIVKYSVRTLIQHNSVTFGNDVGKNFTVDHSNSSSLVESGLSQIASWHNTLIREENLDGNLHHDYGQFSNLRYSAEGDNYNETNLDACIEEEPQNNSDLLPPEIKDAIFEDLPHDILDGISMLDIFPKLMIYEDLITIEGKSDNMLITDSAENCAPQISEEYPPLHHLNKQDSNNKFPYNGVNHVEESNTPGVQAAAPQRELQRSSSEVFLSNFEGFRNQQRSSSVTWGCKIDNARRYFTKGISDVGLSDGRVFNSNYRKLDNENEDHKVNSKKHFIFEDNINLTQIKKDKFKLIQLDGTDDLIIVGNHAQNVTSKTPVKCDRCRCTYRTFDSFQRHLASCEQISTSESETETISRSPDESRATIVLQDDSINNSIQTYQNQMTNNQKFPANITVVRESNVISTEHMIPQSIYVSPSPDYQSELYVNGNKPLYNNVDNKNSIRIDKFCNETECENINNAGVSTFHKSISKNKKYNFINLNNKSKTEQFKACTKTNSETVVPEIVDTINNNKADYNSQGKHSYLQFLNQQLVLNNQYSQKEQQSQQQQFVVIQQSVGNNQPLFIQQVSNPATIPQTIFPVVLSNNSMQYSSMPSSTNPLVQGPILQTDGSGNVILSSGLQMLSMPSLQLTSQSSPQLVGTFNQPQSIHLGSNQMFIGGTTTMELMPNANQVLLAAPPVYYGLETIVQNTVMSSQQFVSTAMQGVLSQNASFSATTTQVFQSSKFEPVSDTPSGYVVLNNTDGTAIVVPQTNLLPGFMNTNGTHDFHSNYTHDYGNVCGTHPQTFLQQPTSSNVLPVVPALSDIPSISVETPLNEIQPKVNLESSPHITSGGKRTVKLTSDVDNVSQKNTSNTQLRNSIQNSTTNSCDTEGSPMVTNNYCNDYNVQVTCKDFEPSSKQNKTSDVSNVHSRNTVEVKQKVAHKYIKRNRPGKITQMGSKLIYKKELKVNQSKELISPKLESKSKAESEADNKKTDEDFDQYLPLLNTNNRKAGYTSQCYTKLEQNCEGRIETCEGSLGSTQNIVPRLKNRPMSQFYSINAAKSPLVTVSFGSNFNNVPTNVVAPILQTHQNNSTPSRPTNRVLPMQSTHKPVEKPKVKSVPLKRPSFRDNLNKLLDSVQSCSDLEIRKTPNRCSSVQSLEKNNEISVCVSKALELKNLISNVSTSSDLSKVTPSFDSNLEKTVADDKMKEDIQSNLNSGDIVSMKMISTDEKSSDEETKTMIESTTELQKPTDEGDAQNKCLNFIKNTDNAKTELKYKSSKQTVVDTQSPKNLYSAPPKNRLENEDIKKASEPYLIYEIQSEDGFSYKSKSIADVWEKVFEAVQNARRAHGLSSLPIGPFADMCGVQMIGLKTNALKYLIEQLPGTERCTKYIPKYHKNVSVNIGSEIIHQDQEELLENIYGAVRCEPFTKRSDYDLFSWLASRHRKQPKQIFVQPSDTELIARRCTANLPMAMKYRTLKETCKYNVGVFRSLIHGRGLFCTKDIEAGEMVIEYAGELIRSTLTDKRERFYDSKGIGCYMFKIDDNFVVDATMRGNAARFINHSCEPNCYSKVVDILGHKHIIIFSLRRIVQGEELTYDYKFPFEDIKIPCSCGSKKCRKYLN